MTIQATIFEQFAKVARLEDLLGVDPITTIEDANFPVTLGEFVKSHDNAFA